MLNIKLTYYGSKNTTMVNMEKYCTMYQTRDTRNGGLFTKIHFSESNYLMVEETPEEIEEIMELVLSGSKQDKVWNVLTVDERFEKEFVPRGHRPRQQNYQPRERNYNNYDSHNYNRY